MAIQDRDSPAQRAIREAYSTAPRNTGPFRSQATLDATPNERQRRAQYIEAQDRDNRHQRDQMGNRLDGSGDGSGEQEPSDANPVSKTIIELIAEVNAQENADAMRAICGILNAITLMKQNVYGTPYWQVPDLQKFSAMVAALHSMRPSEA